MSRCQRRKKDGTAMLNTGCMPEARMNRNVKGIVAMGLITFP